MSKATGRRRTAPARSHRWVLPLAGALLVVQLAFRTWSAWSSWYLQDDLLLLREARPVDDLRYLLEPYAGHLLPAGKLLVLAVASVGGSPWWPATTALVLMQAVAGLAVLWMLVTVFGRRWAVVPLFALFLFLSLSLTAYMWLSAAILYLPLQAALAAGVATWVTYLRERRLRWLVATLLVLAVGLLFWQKAIVLLPLLVFLSLGYFAGPAQGHRVREMSRQLRALVVLLAVGVLYVAYYLARVPSEVSSVTLGLAGRLADVLLGTTFVTGLVGGPWRWDSPTPPNSYADPPDWSVPVAWVVVAAVVAYSILRRRRSARAWVLLLGYVVGTYLLVLMSRASNFGAGIGTEARYLADIPLMLSLCLGLALLEVPGAPGSSSVRAAPLVARAPRGTAVALCAAVLVGSVASSLAYVRPWHDDHAASEFFQRFANDIGARGRTDLVDSAVPEEVMPQFFAPRNTVSYLAPLFTDLAHFPDVSPDLAVVADDGLLHQVLIDHGVDSRPGPVDGCGWKVTSKGRRIPLQASAFDFDWWVRVGYLSSSDSPVTVSAGRSRVETRLRSGLNNLYMRIEGGFDHVDFSGLDRGTTLCVDIVEVGQPEPGGFLP